MNFDTYSKQVRRGKIDRFPFMFLLPIHSNFNNWLRGGDVQGHYTLPVIIPEYVAYSPWEGCTVPFIGSDIHNSCI